jgi:hypothetical protein
VHRRINRQIFLTALLLVKLLGMDLAFMPMAQAVGAADARYGTASSHCATSGASHGEAMQAHATSDRAHAAELPATSHHGCHSGECKCSCAHAPAAVSVAVVTAPSISHVRLAVFSSWPPGSGNVSVLFRPPI